MNAASTAQVERLHSEVEAMQQIVNAEAHQRLEQMQSQHHVVARGTELRGALAHYQQHVRSEMSRQRWDEE